jgi:hypothetical protein
LAGPAVQRLACDTGGFRFASLTNVWDVNFVPGGAKYGDVPGLLALCTATPTVVAGETTDSLAGARASFALANGRLEPAPASSPAALARAVAGGR